MTTAVEVGIGHRTGVARDLAAAGIDVTATDVVERAVPAGVSFVVDDVTDPDPAVYRGADLVYALRCPPDLHAAVRAAARTADAAACFTTLGGDQPAVPARTETVGGSGLFWINEPPSTGLVDRSGHETESP